MTRKNMKMCPVGTIAAMEDDGVYLVLMPDKVHMKAVGTQAAIDRWRFEIQENRAGILLSLRDAEVDAREILLWVKNGSEPS